MGIIPVVFLPDCHFTCYHKDSSDLGQNMTISSWIRVLTHQKAPRCFCMLFFEVLPFTTLASSVNGKTSKKSAQKRRGGVWCFYALRVLTHQKPPRCFCTLFFEVLPFSKLASSVNGKTSKKSVQKRRGGVWCV